MALLADVYRQANRFDVIHSHLDYHTLPFVCTNTTPTVITLHGRLDTPAFQRVYRTYPDANYVAISRSQQSWLPDLHWAGVVHHGVAVEAFPFSPEHGTYLAFVGRISPEKRPDLAIKIASHIGMPLVIAAKVDPADATYYRSTILPLIRDNPLVHFVGAVDERRKRAIMSQARALLLPIDWPEPFGIVFIEALACGTPVVTRPYGAAPELLEDGVTGYLRETVDELAEAVLRIPQTISRHQCRTYAQQRFALPRMATEYLRIYADVRQQRHFSHDLFPERLWRLDRLVTIPTSTQIVGT
jgi:glycosyltransferase involved in cell wall biosynthesis